jgi:hypothetical protein
VSNTALIATGAVEVIRTSAIVDVNGLPLTGLTSIKLAVVRDSDGKILDFASNTFSTTPASPWVAMVELDAARLPGVYSYSLNTGAFVSPAPNDKYKIFVSQQGGTSAANALQSGELRVSLIDTVTSNLNAPVSTLATAAALAAAQGDLAAIKGAGFTPGQDDLHSLHGQVAAVPAGIWATAEGGAAGSALYNLTLARKFITNKMAETTPGLLILYDDNGTAPLKSWQLYDSTGGTVTTQSGEPARREAAT